MRASCFRQGDNAEGKFTRKADRGEHNYHFRFTVADENELERKVNEKISEEKEITI